VNPRAAKYAPDCAKGEFLYLGCKTAVHPMYSDSCLRAYTAVGRDTFFAAFRMYGLLYTLSALGRRKGLDVRKLVSSSIRSGAFIAVFAVIYAVGNCAHVRHHGANLPKWYFLSAFVASFVSILVEQRSRRTELMLYTANVAAESVFNMAVNRGLLKPVKGGANIIFCMAWGVLCYLNLESPSDLDNARQIVDTVHGRRFQPDNWDRKLAALWLKLSGAPPPVDHTHDEHHPSAMPSMPLPVAVVTPHSTEQPLPPSPPLSPRTSLVAPHSPRHGLSRFLPSKLADLSDRAHQDRARQWLLDSDMAYTGVGAVRGLLLGFTLKGGLQLAGAMLSPSKLIRLKWWQLNAMDALRFGVMASAISGGARAIAALLKQARGGVHDGWNEAIGGAIAGSAFAMSGNKEVAMYMGSKATAGLICHAFSKSKIEPPVHGPAFLYALNTAIIFYQSVFEWYNLRPSYWKFLLRVTNGQISHFRDLSIEWRQELGIPGPTNGVI